MATLYEDDRLEVLEGFLCPICCRDQGSFQQLQTHYEVAHAAVGETTGAIPSLKDLIGKAKRKILNRELEQDDEEGSSPEDNQQDNFGVYVSQEIGVTVSHMDFFKAVRNSRTDRYVLETNKLLNRLDKLLTDLPTEPAKRKAHEKSIVNWAADQDVPLCPSCTRSFSLTRRKHHCRLCGGIMCAQCSQFLLHAYAKKLTNQLDDGDEECPPSSSSGFNLLGLSIPRSGSSTSLNSILNPSTGEAHIRVCPECKQLLDRRDNIIRLQNTKPEIVQLYERMKSFVDEALKMHGAYSKICTTLRAGETHYALKEAQDLRIRLMKMDEAIELYSKRILVLGIKDGDVKAFSKAIQLQRAIYLSTNNFLKEKMVGLPSLPTEEDIVQFREKRQREVQEQIAREKAAAVELQRRAESRHAETSPARERTTQRQQVETPSDWVLVDSGWGPLAGVPRTTENDDPIVQQMNIIRNYIRQAKEVHKFEEVSMLEANLRELQDEYWKQQGDANGSAG